ncbi:MAG: hypothetical protein JO322_10545 [Candidatus Eremiobacteraeota bacterium]|nr:hypothetical protein [Candidatus Eremiobacteraeota bacterium]
MVILPGSQQPLGDDIRGTVADASASSVTIATSEGPVTIALAPKTAIAGVVPAKLSDIRQNAFIGVTNIPQPGGARAVGVFLLPDALKNEAGSFPWDYPASGAGGSRMTNGDVSLGSRMTNGTVSKASSEGPLTVTVAYHGGSIDATIPANTPVVRIVPATWKTLARGAHVFAAVHGVDNRPTAAQIVVGEQGVVPPM